MSRRVLALSCIILLGISSLVGLAWSVFGKTELSFTQAEVQERLNRTLPRTVKGVTVERATVSFGADRLTVHASLKGEALRQPVTALVSARGAPRYEPDGHEIHFDADDIRLDQAMIAGRTVLRADEGQGRIATAAATAVRQFADQGVKAWLSTHPVYRFKDDYKGMVLKAVLTKVEVTGDRLVVGFSLWKVTGTSAMFAFWFVVAFVLLLVLRRFPLWGRASGLSITEP